MRVPIVFLSIIFGLVWTEGALAQSERYDPGRLPYDPALFRLEPCGISLPLDPAWSRTSAQTPELFEISAAADTAYWKRVGEPLDRFTVNTSFDVYVRCRQKPRKSMAETQQKLEDYITGLRGRYMGLKGYEKVGKLRREQNRALGRHYRFDYVLKTATTVHVGTYIAAQRGDTFISLDAKINEGPTSGVITGVVFKGKPHKVDDNGRIREIRLLRSTALVGGGVMTSMRLPPENRAFLKRFINGIR